MIEPTAIKEFVEELPRPPAYFKIVTVDTPPPVIPPNALELAQKIYGNRCSTSQLPLYQDNEVLEEILNRDPKEVLKTYATITSAYTSLPRLIIYFPYRRSLKHVLQDLLPMLTIKSHDERDIVANSVAAKNSIVEFNKLLNVYRMHEARQELFEKISLKLEEGKQLEQKLQQ
jgi:hypothetical protein